MTVFFRRGAARGVRRPARPAARREPAGSASSCSTSIAIPSARAASASRSTGAPRSSTQGRRVVVPAVSEEELAGGILRGAARPPPAGGPHDAGTASARRPATRRATAASWRGSTARELRRVDVVSLLDGPLPADTDLVMVAGPQHDFLPAELEKLATLPEGRRRRCCSSLDPATLPSLQRASSAAWASALGDDFVVDHERRVLGHRRARRGGRALPARQPDLRAGAESDRERRGAALGAHGGRRRARCPACRRRASRARRRLGLGDGRRRARAAGRGAVERGARRAGTAVGHRDGRGRGRARARPRPAGRRRRLRLRERRVPRRARQSRRRAQRRRVGRRRGGAGGRRAKNVPEVQRPLSPRADRAAARAACSPRSRAWSRGSCCSRGCW